jgi:anthranilate phosphoribosyltransferase
LQQDKANYCLVHSIDGYDEVSLTSPFKYITKTTEKTIEPESLGFKILKQAGFIWRENNQRSCSIFSSTY